MNKKEYSKSFSIWMTRSNAMHLMELLNGATIGNSSLIGVKKEIEEHLEPYYKYQVECSECRRMINVTSKLPENKRKPTKDFICGDCMDDFK